MSRPGTVRERLRDFVRARVKPGEAFYKRGNASRLAEWLEIDNGWVSDYVDQPPTSHADIDDALRICRFFNVKLTDFESDKEPQRGARPVALTPLVRETVELLEQMNEEGQRHAVNLLRGVVGAFPKALSLKSARRTSGKRAAKDYKAHGKRRAGAGKE